MTAGAMIASHGRRERRRLPTSSQHPDVNTNGPQLARIDGTMLAPPPPDEVVPGHQSAPEKDRSTGTIDLGGVSSSAPTRSPSHRHLYRQGIAAGVS